ncbi:uncharacterized protein LOC142596260 [Pelecanus crispus]|uniref:uncharacterized protein LOC142596260 n=1 Tax=Pelecanus crispus TaxID=36300 RepID=UPI003F5D058D
MSQYDDKSCGGETASMSEGSLLTEVAMPCLHDPAHYEKKCSTCQCAIGHREGNGFWAGDGHKEEPLSGQDGGAFPLPEVPWGTDKRSPRRVVGKQPARHPVCAMVVAVLVVLVVALAVAVQSAGRHGGNPDLPAAGVLDCPEGWVGYHNVCYYLSNSTEKGSWEWSQEQCSSLGASLAMLKMGWEMEFVLRLKGRDDYWIGLRRRGERLEWVDGSSFNQTFPVQGQEPCLYLNNNDLVSSSCSLDRPYVCSKPQAVG